MRLLLSGLQAVHRLVCSDSAYDGRDLLMIAEQGTSSDRNDILHVLCYLFGGLTYAWGVGRTIKTNVVTLVDS